MEKDNVISCEVTENLLTPGMSKELVPGRVAVTHEDCRTVRTFLAADVPYRRAGHVHLLTLDSFVAHCVERMQGTPAIAVYVSSTTATAVFNHEGWQDDLATFDLQSTQDWKSWQDNNGVWMNQEKLCDFLEDQEEVIVQPCGVDLLRLVGDFRQNTQVTYGSSYRGKDGQISLTYHEEKSGASREMELPEVFLLHLPVIKGAEALTTYEIKARLRVRVDKENHQLRLRYDLVKPEVPRDNAMSDMAKYLREKLGKNASVFEGRVVVNPADALSRGACALM